jgi:hypothetical protein
VAYIGTQPLAGQYRKLDDISGGFNGSTTSFTTSVGGTNVTAGSPQQLLVSLGGVIQQPTTDYTVNTSTIIFTTAPTSGLSFFAILMGDALNTSVPADGSITSAKLAGSLSVGLAAGSASTPSLFFSGDANTGIWSPAADTIAFSEGGVEAMRIDSSGRVGIGTSSPNNKFTLQDGSVLVRSEVTTGTSNSHNIGFSATSTGGVAATISSYRENANEASALTFNTWNGSAFGERMRVSASGSVGIGTTTPSAILDVKVASDAKLLVQDGNTTGNVKFNAVNNAVSANVNLEISASNTQFFNGGSERARIDSSGRLLVGTSTALTGATAQYSKNVNIGNSANSAGNAVVTIGRGTAAASLASGNQLGSLYFTDNGAGEFASIDCFVDATPGVNDYPGRLVFSTTADGASSPTERMRIDSTGNLLVGVTSGSNSRFAKDSSGGIALQVFNSSTTDTSSAMELNVNYTGGTSGWFVRGGDSTIYRFYIYSNGNMANSNNSYGAISDIKLKENIVDAGSQWLDLKLLQVRKYNFKEGQTHTQIGLIAQEAELVSPGLVYESPDRDAEGNDLGTVTKSVNYSVLYMKAVKALQEAMERIETLEAKVNALEAQ